MKNQSQTVRVENRLKHRVDPSKKAQSDQRGRKEMGRVMTMTMMVMKAN